MLVSNFIPVILRHKFTIHTVNHHHHHSSCLYPILFESFYVASPQLMFSLNKIKLKSFVEKENAEFASAFRRPIRQKPVTLSAHFVRKIVQAQSFDHDRLPRQRFRWDARLRFRRKNDSNLMNTFKK